MARPGIHYTTIAFVPEKGWYNFNDINVRPVNPPTSNDLADDRNVPFMFFYT